jgi:hypothetical protein
MCLEDGCGRLLRLFGTFTKARGVAFWKNQSRMKYCSTDSGTVGCTWTAWRQVVTKRTTRFTIKHSTYYPHSVFLCFVWIWEQTAIISLCSINWLVFIIEMECVYCAVRSAHTMYLCVLCGSENNQRYTPRSSVTDWLLEPRRSVFTARYVLPTQCIYVFRVHLRTNSDYFTIQH